MDFEDTPEEAAYRAGIRRWLEENATPLTVPHGTRVGVRESKAWQKIKAEAGYAAITWPKEYGGMGGTSMQNVIYGQEESQYNRIRSLVNEELKQYFRPEFLNRLDEIIVFRQLNRDEVKEIADIMLKEVFGRLKEQGITLEVTERFKDRLVTEGYNPSYGARPLRRAIMRLLEDSLAEEILSGSVKNGDIAVVDVDEEGKVKVVQGEKRVLAPGAAE